jgi:hypothetical protein
MQRIKNLVLGGGLALDKIKWERFFLERWTPQQNMVVANERMAWLVDLMLWFVANTLLNSHPKLSKQLLYYTHDFTVQATGERNPEQHARPRAFDKPERPRFQCFLITFLPNEEVALVWLDRDVLELFFPWPAMKQTVMNSVNMVMQVLLQKWVNIPNPKFYTYTFVPGFFQSNIWIVYFACLRMLSSREQVQDAFNNVRLKEDLERRALHTYHKIGQNIALCAARTPSMNQAAFLFRPGGPEFSLNHENMLFLASGFANCQLTPDEVEWFDDVAPLSKTPRIAESDPKWKNFYPQDTNAPRPRFYFVK